MARVAVLFATCALLGCGGAAGGAAGPKRPIDVARAELPFVVYDRAGRQVREAEMLAALADARAVCVGESHSNPHHHWAQLRLIDELSRRAAAAGNAFALGMEMFQAPYQPVLDAYAAGQIDDRVMLARSEWRARWGYDFALYRPLLRIAVERGATLVALNQRKEIVKTVGKRGLAGLSDQQRAALPELVLDDADHRAWFDAIMEDHPDTDGDGSAGPSEQVYTAQVLWDETMADNAARWLAADDARRMVILAGIGHCHDSAIARRIARRGVAPSVSVQPVIDDGNGSADEALRAQHNDYVIVMLAR